MSEWMFALLLRLYPASFRREFGEESLQLVRERLGEERGPMAKLRLWFELAGDLLLSLPREHMRSLRRPRAAQPQAVGAGMFWMVEEHPPAPRSFLVGGVFALLALSLFVFLLNHGGTVVSGGWQVAVSGQDAGFAAQDAETQTPQAAGGAEIDAAERERVIRGVIANIHANYAHAQAAQQVATALRRHLLMGDYDAMDSGNSFAATLNRQMRDVTHDDGLMVIFRAEGLANSHAYTVLHVIDARFGVMVP